MLNHLINIYIKRATPDILAMAGNIAEYVINSPNQSVRQNDETGHVTSTGPVDLINMITQYVEHSSRIRGYHKLRAHVLIMVTKPVQAYLHAVELRTAQVRHLLRSDHPGESLLFLCVVCNDCEVLEEATERLEDEHLEELEKGLVINNDDDDADTNDMNSTTTTSSSSTTTTTSRKSDAGQDGGGGGGVDGGKILLDNVEEELGEAVGAAHRTGTLALLQMQRVIFDDVEELMNDMFGDIPALLRVRNFSLFWTILFLVLTDF